VLKKALHAIKLSDIILFSRKSKQNSAAPVWLPGAEPTVLSMVQVVMNIH